MPRAVLDTNVLPSAIITPRGSPAQVLRLWRAGAFELVTSPSLIEELEGTLRRPKIARKYRLSPAEVRELVSLIVGTAHLVEGTQDRSDVVRDPQDARVIACAEEGRVDFLVTGDMDLLSLGAHQRVQIVRPTDFLKILRGAQ